MSGLARSVGLAEASVSLFVGELHPCLGVDIQTARRAPGGERLRVDCCFDRDLPGALDLAFEAICFLAPLVVVGRELVRISHDPENSRIVLAEIPGDADRSDAHLPEWGL